MSLAPVKRAYERLGREDPLYAVLSHKKFQHNRWDVGEFFLTGREEITKILNYVAGDLGWKLHFGRALDFGAGVGRLSQALAEHFQEVVGLDIAESMVRQAQRFNRFGDQVRYLVNVEDNLRTLDSNCFDFVYSHLTIQHNPPGCGKKYVREFVRVLKPGGLAVFQIPNGPVNRLGAMGDFLYMLRHRHLRHFWRSICRRPQVEIHYIPRPEVEQIVQSAGGKVVDVVATGRKKDKGNNYRYAITK